MGPVVRGRRYRVGIDLELAGRISDELVLEGRCRLQPGRVVLVVFPEGRGSRVLVTEWRLVRVGSRGAHYRGRVRMLPGSGEAPTPGPTAAPC